MQQVIAYNKWLLRGIIVLLFSTVFLFVYTANIWVLVIPFVVAYILLIITNWKHAYWLLLLSIPVSIQFGIFNKSLSLSLPDEPLSWVFLCLLVLLLAYKPDIIPRWFLQHSITSIIVLQFIWLLPTVLFSKVLLFSIKFLIAKTWYLACFFVLPVFIFKDKQDFKKGFLLMLIPMLVTMLIIFTRQAMLHFKFADIGAAIGVYYINHVEYASVISMFFPLVCVAYPLTKKYNTQIRILLLLIILFFFNSHIFHLCPCGIVSYYFCRLYWFCYRQAVCKYYYACFLRNHCHIICVFNTG